MLDSRVYTQSLERRLRQTWPPGLLVLLLIVAACGGRDETGTVIVSEPVAMAELDRERRFRVYLPPGYAESDRRFPVLYMHDGQNLFDSGTASAGEWQVDETLARLVADGGPAIIAVGIDHGAKHRLNEMAPWQHQDFGTPEADAYLAFIVEQVKPAVDNRYRTRPGRDDTGILGASMGGLVSHYAAFRYPETFSKVGALSPSYWWSESIFEMTRAQQAQPDTRFYLLVGSDEQDIMIDAAIRMRSTLEDAGYDNVSFRRKTGAGHDEALWGRAFGEAVSFLFGGRTAR